MKSGHWFGIFIGCAGLELAGYVFPKVATIPMVVWTCVGLWFLSITWREIHQALREDWHQHQYLPLGLILLWALIIFGGIHSPSVIPLNHEAAHQVIAAIEKISLYPDIGYLRNSFLEYPNRQYIVNALPTLIAGPGIFALRFGFALPFFLGLLLSYASIRKIPVLSAWKSAGTAYLLMLAAFPVLLQYVLTYEQVVNSLSFTMLCMGWYFIFLDSPTDRHYFALIWSGSLLCYSYTPSLAALLLLIAALASVKEQVASTSFHKARLIGGMLFLMVCMLISLHMKNSSIWQTGAASVYGLTTWDQLCALIISNLFSERAFFNWLLSKVFLVYFIFALAGKLGARHFYVVGWTIVTVCMAIVFRGYFLRPTSVSLHRALVVLPVLSVAVMALSCQIEGLKQKLRPAIVPVLSVLALLNVSFRALQDIKISTPDIIMDQVLKDSGGRLTNYGTVCWVGFGKQENNVSAYWEYLLPKGGFTFILDLNDISKCIGRDTVFVESSVYAEHSQLFWGLNKIGELSLDGKRVFKLTRKFKS